MYYIKGTDKNKINTYFHNFMSAFNFQQKKYPNGFILYSKNDMVEIVWNPFWENLDCKLL